MRSTKTITVNYSNQLNSTSYDVYAFSLACISKVQVHAPRGCVSRCYAPANDIFAAICECNEPLTHPKSAYMHESRGIERILVCFQKTSSQIFHSFNHSWMFRSFKQLVLWWQSCIFSYLEQVFASYNYWMD